MLAMREEQNIPVLVAHLAGSVVVLVVLVQSMRSRCEDAFERERSKWRHTKDVEVEGAKVSCLLSETSRQSRLLSKATTAPAISKAAARLIDNLAPAFQSFN
jgi:hypothetical protein